MIRAVAYAPTLPAVQRVQCISIGGLCKKLSELLARAFEYIRTLFARFFAFSPQQTTSLDNRGMRMAGSLNLVAFYRGTEPNNNNVTLEQMLAWDDGQLEAVHDYIQWLFPLKTRSGPNPTAAVLDDATIQAFRGDPHLKNQVLRSFRRMLTFYGLQMDETTKVITRAPNFNERAAVWLINPVGHHNFLRITRIIHSLTLLGLPEYGQSFFAIMQDIRNREGLNIISEQTFQFWSSASTQP